MVVKCQCIPLNLMYILTIWCFFRLSTELWCLLSVNGPQTTTPGKRFLIWVCKMLNITCKTNILQIRTLIYSRTMRKMCTWFIGSFSGGSTYGNTVVSNPFHSVTILLFSSTRSRDFDGTPGTELPVSMYTTKTPIDMCRFNVRSST